MWASYLMVLVIIPGVGEHGQFVIVSEMVSDVIKDVYCDVSCLVFY